MLRAALQATLEHVLTNASEAADGRQDDAVVHQLRVGLRRLRTALRELGACVPALDSAGPEELARAFEALGRTRDRATITAVLNDAGIAAPGLVGNAQRDEPGRSPQDVVRATSFQVAMLDLLQWAHAEDARFALLQPDAVKRLVAHRLERLHRTVTRHHRRFASMPVDEQHRIRKRLKRLRYLAQFVGGIGWPEAARVGSYLAALEPAQEALGACNDLAMAMTSLDRLAGTSAALPRAFDAVEVGHLLQMRLRGQAKTAARALGAVAKARRFWR